MRILGLTGSIGMGKSVAGGVLRRLGVPVHDSDAAVHCAMGAGGAAVAEVGRAFPGVARNGVIDRRKLGDHVFADPEALRRLEAILHPLVRVSADRMLAAAARRRAPIVALDIPLLYETGAAGRCDAVAVVSAPAFLQAQRVLRRKGMTPARLAQILQHQVPDSEKRRRADFVVSTGLGRERSLRGLRRALRLMRRRPARAWRPGYTFLT